MGKAFYVLLVDSHTRVPTLHIDVAHDPRARPQTRYTTLCGRIGRTRVPNTVELVISQECETCTAVLEKVDAG